MKIKKLVTYLAISCTAVGLLACNGGGSGSSGNSGGGQNDETLRYNLTVTNKSAVAVSIQAAGATQCSISPNATTSCQLGVYTTYQAIYPGQYAQQGIFTIQKNTNSVLQTTPRTANSAIADFVINVNANNGYSGSVDTFLNSSGGIVASGSCRPDSGGVTCTLANGDSLRNLNITLTSDYKPGGDTPVGPTPTKTNSGIYVSGMGNWSASTTYTPAWNNSVNAMVYPEVNYNGQTYVACYGADVGKNPATVITQQPWGPWFVFSNSQTKNPCN